PFTTGTVFIRNVGVGAGVTTTITAHGGDTVTPMGARNISLVAGGIGLGGGSNLSQLMLPEPGAAGLLAAVIALPGIAPARARSRYGGADRGRAAAQSGLQ